MKIFHEIVNFISQLNNTDQFIPLHEPSFIGNEVDESDLEKYETIKCDIKVGDLVIFDHNMVHCTESVSDSVVPRIDGIRRFVVNRKGFPIACSETKATDKGDIMAEANRKSKFVSLMKV